MSSSSGDHRGVKTEPSAPLFGWPTGDGMLVLLIATTLAVVPFLATMAAPPLRLGPWGYAAWLAAAVAVGLAAASGMQAGAGTEAGDRRRPASLPLDNPPTVEGFHARMGGWGNYVGAVALVLGTTASSGAVALVMAQTLLPGQEMGARLLAVGGLVGFVFAQSVFREPPSRLVTALVLLSVAGLLALTVHVVRMVDDVLLVPLHPSAALGPGHVLEAAGLLVFALRPLVRMRLLVPSLPTKWRAVASSRRWQVVVAGTGIVFAVLLTQALDAVLESEAHTGAVLADVVASGGPWVDLTVRFVTLAFGTVWLLVSLSDSRLVSGRIARANAVPDIFTPESDRRRGMPQAGDMLVLLAILVGLLFAPDVRSLVGFAAFCFLVLFGSLHIAVILTADRSGRPPLGAVVGTALTGLLVFSLAPGVILAGVGLVSLAVILRAIFIVWIEPLQPDIVEGLEAPDGNASAAASGRAEDAAGDLPSDDGAR